MPQGVVLVLLVAMSSTYLMTATSGVQTTTDLGLSNNKFMFDLYDRVRHLPESDGANIFFSPFSITTALAMTYLGARGNTATEMADVLYFDELDDTHALYEQLLATLSGADKNYTLAVANRLFGNDGYTFGAQFIADSDRYYGAELLPMDFGGEPEASRVAINEWVEDQTNEKIQNLLPQNSITSGVILVLVNAIYFKGQWKVIFEAENTRMKRFYLSGGNQYVDAELMNVTSQFRYGEIESLSSKIIEIPYDGDDLSMVIVLPDRADGIAALEDALTHGALATALDGMQRQEVTLVMPKFEATTPIQLSDILVLMGLVDLFDGASDLTGIGPGLQVDEVYHKAFIKVNEEGTEAAAATAVVVIESAAVVDPPPPPTFTADHPFLYMIREQSSGVVLFMGRLTVPSDDADVVTCPQGDVTCHATSQPNDPSTSSTLSVYTSSLFIVGVLYSVILVYKHVLRLQ